MEIARRPAELFRAHNLRFELAGVLDHVIVSMFYAGRFEEADAIGAELSPLIDDLGARGAAAMLAQNGAFMALARRGDLEAFGRAATRVGEAYASTGGPWRHFGPVIDALSLLLKGRWAEAARLAQDARAGWSTSNQWDGWIVGYRILFEAHHDPSTALRLFNAERHLLPSAATPALAGRRFMAGEIVEPLALIGERGHAAALYPLVRDAIADGAIVHLRGLAECAAGIAAASACDWDRAESHFATALGQAHTLPHRIAQPEVRRWHAWMLRRRDAPGDRERAAGMLVEALALYREIGMTGHAVLVEKALAEAAPA